MAVDQRVLEIIIRAKDETAKAMKSAGKSVAGIGDSAKLAAGGAAAITAGAAIAGGLNAAADSAAAYGSQVLTLQRLTGAGAAESSKWTAVLSRYGVTGTSAGRIVKTLDTAIVGHSKALAAAGIATQDASGHNRSAQAVLADLAQYYSTATDKTAATALASKTLGKGYLSLLPLLANGKSGIDGLTKAAEKNGQVLSQKQINDVKAYGKAMADNKAAASGLTTQMGLLLLPLKTMGEQVLSKVLSGLNKMSPGLKAAIVIGAVVTTAVLLLGGALMTLGAVAPLIGTGMTIVSGAFSAEALSAAAAWVATLGPIALIIAGIALLAAGVYLVIKHWSSISAFFKKLWAGLLNSIRGFSASVSKFFSSLSTSVKKVFAKWGPVILAVLAPFIGIPLIIAKHWNTIGPAISRIWNGALSTVKGAINGIIGFIKGLPARAADALKGLASAIGAPVKKALDVLSYLNPFQRHSPSLVDNVIAGTAQIAKTYAGISGIKVGAPSFGAFSAPSVAFAGSGHSASKTGGGNLQARLVAVLERLESEGVTASIDGRQLTRSVAKVNIQSSRSGGK